MTPKQAALRVSAEPSLSESPMINIGSDSGCSNSYLNPIQRRSKEDRLLALPAAERDAIAARFWSNVDRRGPDECWLCSLSSGDRVGHRQFTARINGTQAHFYAHRIAWLLTYGESAGDLKVCHRCDNPPCSNPLHLFCDTQAANLADARNKGRLDETLPRTRKLTLADRLAILTAPPMRGVCVALAKHYGVTKACISIIRRGRFSVGSRRRPSIFERVPSVLRPVLGEVR